MKKLRKNTLFEEIMRTESRIRVVLDFRIWLYRILRNLFFSRTWIIFSHNFYQLRNFSESHLIMSEGFIKFLFYRDRYRRSRSRDERRSRSRSRGGRRGRSRSGERRSVSPSRYRKQRHFGDRQVCKFFFYITKSLINICNLFFIQEPNRSRCLGVFNLGRRTSEDEFRRIFERYGKIEVKPHYFKFWNIWILSSISNIFVLKFVSTFVNWCVIDVFLEL